VDRESGKERSVRASWLIAADGAQSSIRSMLGIGMPGSRDLGHRMGIYFRADLREVGHDRPALLYLLSPPEGAGVMAAVNLADLWLYMAPFRPDQGEQVEDFDQARCVELVRSAVGDQDLAVEVLSALPWAASAGVAEHFRKRPGLLGWGCGSPDTADRRPGNERRHPGRAQPRVEARR